MYSYRSGTWSSVQCTCILGLAAVATKRGQYQRFKQNDRNYLQGDHCHDALKTTPELKSLVKQLDSALYVDQDGLSRLAELQRLFDNLIKSSGVFARLLQFIKDVYTEAMSSVMMYSYVHPRKHSSDCDAIQPASVELLQLKKQLHQLEVESRVILQENDRLRKELSSQLLSKMNIQDGRESQVPPPPVEDYAHKVEKLQLQIAKQHASIAEVARARKGRVPLSVCHQLEQCLREAEIEIKKQQRHRDHLTEQIRIEELKSSESTD